MKFHVHYFFLFSLLASAFLPYNSCLAMEEETQHEAEAKELLEKNRQGSQYVEFPHAVWEASQTPDTPPHEESPKIASNKCGTWLCNNKAAIFMFIFLGGASIVAYYFYSLLNGECQKMKGACDGAVGEVDGIMQDITELKQYGEALYNFTSNCPNSRNKLIQQIATFLENCCDEQPQ